ncbi:hypothetical protein CSX11_03270 [Mycobacterium goodii]|nr:hypothetical protein CSX11_03270 [Mycolicibacterium goodii]
MPYIRDSFWAGRQFESIPQMQREGLRWSTEVYGLHKHRGRDGATPSSVFDAVERDALMPLPRRPFEPAIYTVGAVAPDCHVRSGNAFYSVPWRLLGQRVTVRAAGDVVQMFQAHFFVLLRWGGRGDHVVRGLGVAIVAVTRSMGVRHDPAGAGRPGR